MSMGLRQEEDIIQPMKRHQVVIIIKIAVCKFKWSITKRSSAWILPSIVVSMDL